MTIDPHAWMTSVPLMLVMVALYFQSPDHPLMRCWQALMRFERDVWYGLGGGRLTRDASWWPTWQTAVYWMAVGALGAGSLLSFGTFLGLLS